MTTVALSDELESLKTNFPKIRITSATSHFVSFTYERTVYARVKAMLTFPEDYPAHALLVSISLVPPGLQKKLERELGKVAQALSSLPQVAAVVQHLLTFMDTNKFVPCWKDLKQVVELVKAAHETSTIALNETKGLIQLRLTRGKYYYACSITVDENYPSTTTHETWGNACKLVTRETNFCPQIETMLTLQAKEFVRCMQDGMSAEKALYYSNPIKVPNEEESKTEVVVTATKQGNAQVKPHNTNERKDVICKIAKTEWQEKEQGRLESYQLDDYADPQPSLLSLVTFLRSRIQLLPDEKCPICKELTLPSNPEELKTMYTKEGNRKKRPIRTHCGCWYHYSCLNKFMVEPPFGSGCPTRDCGERVYHPDWPADRKELERGWANKQARQREIEDAAMFL